MRASNKRSLFVLCAAGAVRRAGGHSISMIWKCPSLMCWTSLGWVRATLKISRLIGTVTQWSYLHRHCAALRAKSRARKQKRNLSFGTLEQISKMKKELLLRGPLHHEMTGRDFSLLLFSLGFYGCSSLVSRRLVLSTCWWWLGIGKYEISSALHVVEKRLKVTRVEEEEEEKKEKKDERENERKNNQKSSLFLPWFFFLLLAHDGERKRLGRRIPNRQTGRQQQGEEEDDEPLCWSPFTFFHLPTNNSPMNIYSLVSFLLLSTCFFLHIVLGCDGEWPFSIASWFLVSFLFFWAEQSDLNQALRSCAPHWHL